MSQVFGKHHVAVHRPIDTRWYTWPVPAGSDPVAYAEAVASNEKSGTAIILWDDHPSKDPNAVRIIIRGAE